MNPLVASFEASRERLMGLAYRMLGSRSDAEDILQDAYLRILEVRPDKVRNAEAYLMTVVSRLCLDQAKSARRRREVYVGPWLPEPIVDQTAPSPESIVALADDLSFALLLTLQKLSPAERAAFLLHDVFDAPFSEIAETLNRSEAACRQLATRARKAVASGRPGRPAPVAEHKLLLQKFLETLASGDISQLTALLKADAVAYSDGGGAKQAALNPIYGADKVARFFLGLARKHQRNGGTSRWVELTINGLPGVIGYFDSELDSSFTLAVDEGRIAAIYMVRNPAKLGAVRDVLPAELDDESSPFPAEEKAR
ncbi:MAG: sigma-70 family RNA polymerase sigma factor [Kiloniellales bacterium]